MKETADSKVPSSDLGAFERAASANDSTDTTQKFPTWKEMGFLRKGVGNHRRTSNLTVLLNAKKEKKRKNNTPLIRMLRVKIGVVQRSE